MGPEQLLRDAISVALLPPSPARLREAHAARRAWLMMPLLVERRSYARALQRQLAELGVQLRLQVPERAPVRDTEARTLQWRAFALDRGHELVEQGVRVRRDATAGRWWVDSSPRIWPHPKPTHPIIQIDPPMGRG